MKDFYIFLDVDGVLCSWTWIIHFYHNIKESDYYEKYLSPNNVKVLDNFLTKLRLHNLKPVIVVASTAWRDDEDIIKLEKTLKRYGLNYSDTFKRTTTQEGGDRLNQVLKYIDDYNEENPTKPIKNNFVIVDDETKNMQGRIDEKFIITATGVYKDGLTDENINNYFKNHFANLNIDKSKEE